MKKFALILLLGLLSSVTVYSQEEKEKSWNFKVEPYIIFPNMAGSLGIRNLPNVDIDASSGDIFDRLQGAFMIYTEANNGQWAIGADFVYMKLAQNIKPIELLTGGRVTMNQTIFMLEGYYRILPWFEAGLGGRIVGMGSELNISQNLPGPNGGQTVSFQGEISETWFDPLILVRAQLPNSEKWIGEFKADIGGFGIGSDFTYQFQLYGGYRFSRLFQATAGYRFLGIDYENGAGIDRFFYNVNTSGPVIRLGFNF